MPARAIAWTVGNLCMLCAAMFMCYTRVGNKMFRLSGLPIGGFHSKVAASAVLGHDDRNWCTYFGIRTAEGFRSESWEEDVLNSPPVY